MYHYWGLVDRDSRRLVSEDGADPGLGMPPVAERLHGTLFPPDGAAPIEWNRIGFMQDVSMRLIAERLLAPMMSGHTYLPGELSIERPRLPPPSRGKCYHVCCSAHNHGALALMQELREALSLANLQLTDQVADVSLSERFLVYLNDQTFRGGSRTVATMSGEDSLASAGFVGDVDRAIAAGTKLLVVHEYPGMDPPSERGALPFQEVLLRTPQRLRACGIYHMIAIALKGGEWRRASFVMLAHELADSLAKRGRLRSTPSRVATWAPWAWAAARARVDAEARENGLAPLGGAEQQIVYTRGGRRIVAPSSKASVRKSLSSHMGPSGRLSAADGAILPSDQL